VARSFIVKRNNYKEQNCMYCRRRLEEKIVIMINPSNSKDMKDRQERYGSRVFPKLHVGCFEPWIREARKILKRRQPDILAELV